MKLLFCTICCALLMLNCTNGDMQLNSETGLYNFKAKSIVATDGDSVVVTIGRGFHETKGNLRLRLIGIDSFETTRSSRAKDQVKYYKMKMSEVLRLGLLAKKEMEDILEKHKGNIIVHTINKADSFGRWLSTIYYVTPSGNWVDINKIMLTKEHTNIYRKLK